MPEPSCFQRPAGVHGSTSLAVLHLVAHLAQVPDPTPRPRSAKDLDERHAGRAFERSLEGRYHIKPELAAVVGAERFLAEMETTANLQHPHILPLFDSGEDSFLFYGTPWNTRHFKRVACPEMAERIRTPWSSV